MLMSLVIHAKTPAWWRHQMETFSALLSLCEGNSLVTGGFPSQRPVTRSFDVFYYLRLNKRLSKQSTRRWYEAPSRSLWRHSNVIGLPNLSKCQIQQLHWWIHLVLVSYMVSVWTRRSGLSLKFGIWFHKICNIFHKIRVRYMVSYWWFTPPVGTRRNDKVIITPKRHRNVILT